MKRFFGFFAVFLLFFGHFGFTESLFQAQPDLYGGLGRAGDAIPAMKGLRAGRLPNGLSYYILENSLPKDRAYLTLAVRAGSILENGDELGLAHFTEHMAFNGTRRFPEAELIQYLRSLGMRFGPEVNAYTGYDQTVYGIETPIETGEDGVRRIPEKALAILDDWTHAITFAEKDVDDERSVIIEEYRSRLGAQERIREKLLAAIFRGSRYAARSPIGDPEIIRTAPAGRLEAFYKRWYRSDNMAVILVGDFDGKVLEAELSSHFTISKPAEPLYRPYYELPGPVHGGVHIETISDPELPYATVYLYYKRSYDDYKKDLQAFRKNIIVYLVSSMTDVRNEDASSREDAPFIEAADWTSWYGKLSRYYIMAAQAKNGLTGETLKALLLEKEALVRYGFTLREFERAKASLVAYMEFQVSEKGRRESESFIDSFTENFLKGGQTSDLEWELDAIQRILPGITLETVNGAIRSYFEDDDLTVLIAVPETEAGVPDHEAILALIEELRESDLAISGETDENGGFFDETPFPGNIARESRDLSGAVLWTLDNGARVILKETANRNNAVTLYALAKGGESSVPQDDDFSAYLASEMQNASGLGPFSKPELSRYLSDKHISFSFWTDTYIRGFNGESSLVDLGHFFRILYLSFVRPKIDNTGFTLVREARRTRLVQEKDNPEMIFSKELTKMIYNNHPRFRPLELEDLDRLDAEKALSFLKKALNPADYTFVFVGNLGPSEEGRYPLMRSMIENWLASIPGAGSEEYPESWNSWDNPGITRPGVKEQFVYKGREKKSTVYMAWFAPLRWTETANASALVLNEYLDIVLNDEIREHLGGVYSISEHLALAAVPSGELSLGVYFNCDPDRSGELRDAVKAKLGEIASGGIDEVIFARAKEALVKNFESSMENNAFIARNYANFALVLDIPLSRLAERPELYRSVSLEDIRVTAEQVLGGGPAELILLPEANAR